MINNINRYRYWLIKPKGSDIVYLMNKEPKYNEVPYYDFECSNTEDFLDMYCVYSFDVEHEVTCLSFLHIMPKDEKPVEFLLIYGEDKDEAIKLLSEKSTTKSSLNKKLLF